MITKKETIKKIVKSHNKKITKNNAAFEKLSPSEKRVQIARDVIAQLKSKRLDANYGTWLDGYDKSLFDNSDLEKDSDLKDILAKTETCIGCAVGGLFMCAVKRADSPIRVSNLFEVDSYQLGMNDAFSYLKKFFSEDQLELIECAFERNNGAVYRHDDLGKIAKQFVKDVDDPQTRMRLIMENIIDNDGTFEPEKSPIGCITPGHQK